MAQIDSRIALGFQPQTQIQDPTNALAKMLQVQGAQQEGQMRAMQMQDAQDARTTKNKLAELYRTSVGADGKVDRNRLLQGAAQQGLGAKIPGLQKEFADADEQQGKIGKTTAETEKLQIASQREKLSLVGQLLNGVRDQATYDQARMTAQQNGLDVSAMPPQYDPAMVAQKLQQALTVEEQLAQVWRQKGYDLDVRQQTEVERNNKTQNSISQGNLRVAQGNLAVSGQRLKLDQQQGPAGKPPAGYRWTPTGELEPIPGGPGAQRAAEVGFKQGERNDAKDAKRASISAQIAVVDKALKHPGRETSTGLSGTLDPRNFIPGTDAADFRAVLDQIGGTAFLQAFESLKGGGQITETEGKKATDAIARLSRAQSDSELKQSLNDLREVMVKGQQRLGGEAPAQDAMSAQDKQAMEWASANPNDPRAQEIKQRLGGR